MTCCEQKLIFIDFQRALATKHETCRNHYLIALSIFWAPDGSCRHHGLVARAHWKLLVVFMKNFLFLLLLSWFELSFTAWLNIGWQWPLIYNTSCGKNCPQKAVDPLRIIKHFIFPPFNFNFNRINAHLISSWYFKELHKHP